MIQAFLSFLPYLFEIATSWDRLLVWASPTPHSSWDCICPAPQLLLKRGPLISNLVCALYFI